MMLTRADLNIEWNSGDNQDVVAVWDRRRPSDWPLLEMDPAEAIAICTDVIAKATEALSAAYTIGRIARQDRTTSGGGVAVADFYAEDRDREYADQTDDEVLAEARAGRAAVEADRAARRRRRCPAYAGRWLS